MASSIDEKYVFMTAEDSVIQKDWAAGSSKQLNSKEFIVKKAGRGYTAQFMDVKYPPALWKIIDEPIVNALDHLVRCHGTTNPVTSIRVSVDDIGRIRVYNNGPGVEIEIHKTASAQLGRTVYVPTFVFGMLFQGSNKNQPDDSIIGGTNGLGAKLSNCFSLEFAVETVHNGKYFLQKWRDHKNIEEPPIIVDLTRGHKVPADRAHPHTTLSFMPDYVGIFGYNGFAEVKELLCDLVRTRVMFAAAYANFTAQVDIMFNDEKINIKSMHEIGAILFPNAQIIKTMVDPKIIGKNIHMKHPWEICAVITDTTGYDTNAMSIVNGVVVRDGKHHKFISDKITEGVREAVGKYMHDKNLKFSPMYVKNNVFILMNTKIPKTNISWTGQRKDILDINIRKLAGYIIDPKFVAQISGLIRDKIINGIIDSEPTVSGKKKNTKTEYEKYKGARLAGSKKSHLCGLIPVEGDSAMTQVCMGISENLNWDYFGAISLGGVIMNARKKCHVIESASGTFIKKSSKLTKNIFMNVLCEVTGLNTSYKYEQGSPTYKKEISELRYGYLAVCVDQDLDGKGFILGLILNVFDLFWPNLLSAGYVKWFCTPIMRAYPKAGGTVKAFYSILEYENWTADPARYNIKYYKGLGTHSRDETLHMFKSFTDHLYTYGVDPRSRRMFEVYFGKNTDLRKIELSRPIVDISKELMAQQESTKIIFCSDHLENETFLFHKDNLERKLDHVIDGQNQAGRKILDGLIKALPGNRSLKVSQLAGYVSEHENYHHGEDSLCSSITNRGFVAVGGKQLPLIVPLSNFGSRIGGGADAASPRYIYAKLNKEIVDLTFPPVDYHILEFNFDEGKRSEPKFFVPIIPMAVIESTELPSTGWKLKTWGRDVFKVIENVRRLILVGDDAPLLRMPPTAYAGSPYEWKGTFKNIRGELHSFGKYTICGNKLTITELPLRVWNTKYIKKLKKKLTTDKTIVTDFNDLSNDLRVTIEIDLVPGALNILDEMADSIWTTGVEEYFKLRKRMESNINFMGIDKEILCFQNYEQPMYKWFPVRKEYYAKRLRRQGIMLNLEVMMLENIIRYITSGDLGLARQKRAVMDEIMDKNNFAKFNAAKFRYPKFTPTDALENKILNEKADYGYLLSISDAGKSSESLEEYYQKLAQARASIDELNRVSAEGRFPGASIWLQELHKLEHQIAEGQKTFWKYGDSDKFVLG